MEVRGVIISLKFVAKLLVAAELELSSKFLSRNFFFPSICNVFK